MVHGVGREIIMCFLLLTMDERRKTFNLDGPFFEYLQS